MSETINETVAGLARSLREGRVDAVTLTQRCLQRIAADNPKLNAFVSVFEAQALDEAKRADYELAAGVDRGPLHGVPVAVKENFDVAGIATTGCSTALRDNVADTDAHAVAQLRKAGAVIIGRTNMHELAYGGTGQVSSAGPVRNPRDPERLAGGSSSGSAAAVAAGMVPVALGTDTGGSVRIPASACGLVGLKPTFDHISTQGVMPLSWTLDHVGPLAHTVEDVAITKAVLAGETDFAAPEPTSARLHIGVAQLRNLVIDSAVGERIRRAVDALQNGGHSISYFDLEYTRQAHQSWLAIMYPEAACGFEALLDHRYEDFDVTIRTQLEAGRHVDATTYLRAQRFRAFYGRHFTDIAADYDLLCMPTLPTVAPKVGQKTVELPSGTISTQDAMTFSNLTANMLGWPAINLPMATREGELPAGLSLLRPANQDRTLLADAAAIAPVIDNRQALESTPAK